MNYKSNISFIIIIFVGLFLSSSNFQNREYDWDLPGYVGSLLAYSYGSYNSSVHQEVYKVIKSEATESQFQNLNGLGKNTRYLYFKNSDSFKEILPYYQIKLGYNLVVRFFYGLGFSAPYSVLLPNSIFYFLIVVSFYLILKKIIPNKPFLVFLIGLAFSFLPPLRLLSEMASPDIMVLFLIIIFMSFIIGKKNDFSIFLIVSAIVITRPDYIVFALTYYFLILIQKFLIEKKRDFTIIYFPLIIFLLYLLILTTYHYPGWKDVFYDTFIHRRDFISKEKAEFSVMQYVTVISNNLFHFKKTAFISFLLLFFTFYFNKNRNIRLFSFFLWINIFLKFLFFPAIEIRFFLPFILSLFIWLIFAIQNNSIIQKNTYNEN